MRVSRSPRGGGKGDQDTELRQINRALTSAPTSDRKKPKGKNHVKNHEKNRGAGARPRATPHSVCVHVVHLCCSGGTIIWLRGVVTRRRDARAARARVRASRRARACSTAYRRALSGALFELFVPPPTVPPIPMNSVKNFLQDAQWPLSVSLMY